MDNNSQQNKTSPLSMDLKNIDVAQLLPQIMEQKALLLQVLLLGWAGMMAIGAVQQLMQDKASVDSQMNLLRSKVEVIETWRGLEKQQQQYLASVPPALDIDGLVGYLTDLAERYRIDIVSLAPGRPQEALYYQAVVVDVNCNVSSFKDLILFLQDVEKNKHALRVTALAITQRGEKGLDVRLQAISVKLKTK